MLISVFISSRLFIVVSLVVCVLIQLRANPLSYKVNIVTDITPPLQYFNNGVLTGQSVEVVTKALNVAGIEANTSVMPWARAYHKALTEPNTLIYSIARNQHREEQFIWLGQIAEYKTAYVSLNNGKEIVVNNDKDAMKYIIGSLRSGMMHEYLINNGFEEGRHFVLHANLTGLVKLLYKGQIDLILADPKLLAHFASSLGFSGAQLKTHYYLPGHHYQLYLAANKNTPVEVVKQITNALSVIKPQF